MCKQRDKDKWPEEAYMVCRELGVRHSGVRRSTYAYKAFGALLTRLDDNPKKINKDL